MERESLLDERSGLSDLDAWTGNGIGRRHPEVDTELSKSLIKPCSNVSL